MIEIAKQKQH